MIVNKKDVLGGKNSMLYEEVMKAVPEEIQTLIPGFAFLIDVPPVMLLFLHTHLM